MGFDEISARASSSFKYDNHLPKEEWKDEKSTDAHDGNHP
jgi:hypothetical protein